MNYYEFDLAYILKNEGKWFADYNHKIRIINELFTVIVFFAENDKDKVFLHGDIKPSNFLVDIQIESKLVNHVYFADFEYSTTLDIKKNKDIEFEAITEAYFPPEPNVNEKTDIYSFGLVALEILLGELIPREEKKKLKDPHTFLEAWGNIESKLQALNIDQRLIFKKMIEIDPQTRADIKTIKLEMGILKRIF